MAADLYRNGKKMHKMGRNRDEKSKDTTGGTEIKDGIGKLVKE